MRSEFMPEARAWREKQILNFDLMHGAPPPTDAVNWILQWRKHALAAYHMRLMASR